MQSNPLLYDIDEDNSARAKDLRHSARLADYFLTIRRALGHWKSVHGETVALAQARANAGGGWGKALRNIHAAQRKARQSWG
jgi:hypothetical protein